MAKQDLEMAIQQFTGYRYAESGPMDIVGLAESMGLTAKEWRAIRTDVQWLGHRNLDELDEHFKEQAK